ncbi:MAG: hypothetical protein WC718_14980 [Phycisphaerales bacterium]|jgi:hypothetical protein
MLHNLGAFFGHVIRGVKTPATPPPRVIREEVREHPVDLPEGRVVLRRVIRDEVLPAPASPKRTPDSP